MLRDFAYCLPFEYEPNSAYQDESKSCRAERYGGKGISGNGGGVRCGWMGDMTVKGIGRTELAGQDTPFWHSYGGASMREAIREVVWGETFHAALPYGAVRVEAIIGTGTSVPLHYTDSLGGDTCPRALILRRPFLRPAHYMRSLFFQPSPGFSEKYASDAIRTAAAVRQLEIGLRAALQGTGSATIVEILHVAARRYASQLAVSRAKRLLHGSVTPSNITLDGRFLDFGMTSAVSDHGRIIIARGWPDPWTQHEPMARALGELSFYLRKYDQIHGLEDGLGEELQECFLDELDRVFRAELLKLSGIPAVVLRGLEKSAARLVSDCFIEVLEAGSREPFKLLCPCPAYVPSMPPKMGSYHLGECLKACAAAQDQRQADVMLGSLITDTTLRNRLVAAYWLLRETAMRQYQDQDNFSIFLRFNARRLNHDLHNLYAIVLNRDIDRLLVDQGDVASFINTRVREAVMLVSDCKDGIVELGDDVLIHADPATGVNARTRAGLSLPLSEIAGNLPFSISEHETVHA